MFFSSSHSMALRITVLDILLQIILCFSLQIQAPVEFCGPHLIPLSEKQRPQHQRLHVANWSVLLIGGERFWKEGGNLKDFKEIFQQKKKELEKPNQSINLLPKTV